MRTYSVIVGAVERLQETPVLQGPWGNRFFLCLELQESRDKAVVYSQGAPPFTFKRKQTMSSVICMAALAIGEETDGVRLRFVEYRGLVYRPMVSA